MKIDLSIKEPTKENAWVINFSSTLVYVLLGSLGLSFAISPGYASPIFPASGYAVAILLKTNTRAWPGIFFGSLILNLGNFWLLGGLDEFKLLLCISIALGSTLQSLMASWLVVRTIKNAWQLMITEREILICLLVAGPVACLLSASIGIASLYFWGAISVDHVLLSWWNWWSGDTFGVLVMMPLSLTFLCRSHAVWRKRLTILVIPMTITLALVATAFSIVSDWELNQQKLKIQTYGETLAKLLEQRFIAHQEALSALRRVIEVSPDISYSQFEYFTNITLSDNPDVFALSINPYITRHGRSNFERQMAKNTGIDSFEIKEKNQQGKLIRSAEKDEYVAVGYIAPLKWNQPAIGYDINSDAVRHVAIEQAIKSKKPSVTMPIHLVQENKKRVGVLLIHPAFYQSLLPINFLTRKDLIGFAVGVIKVDEMVEIATQSAQVKEIAFQLEDTFSTNIVTLYQSDPTTSPDNEYIWQKQIRMADRLWTIKTYPTAFYLTSNEHWTALAIGIVGLFLSALLQIMLLVTTGSHAIIQRKVKEQTAELFAKGSELQDRNAELNTLFSLSPDGFVALSPNGIVKLVNPAFQTITGILADSIVNNTETFLESELRLRCENPLKFPGISAYFKPSRKNEQYHVLKLVEPAHTVIQIVGMSSESSELSRILYLRNITREAEVDQMKSDFLAHAAHELRTPMSSIYGFSELLLNMEFDEATRRELIETIYRQTHWLMSIINELLDLARIEERRGKDFKLEILEIGALLDEVVANFKPPVDRNTPSITQSAPKWLEADRSKLLQALTNVLSNAYKYSRVNTEVSIVVIDNDDSENIKDSADINKGKIGIRISDHGIGMTPQQLSHVFERFYRADTSGNIPGTGLGMSITKEIIELHNGNIDLESKEGMGTTVTLWLPKILKT